MNHPLCSVVLATFNRWHLLDLSLVGYLNQSFPREELELVVIDDHSTDDTARQVADSCDNYGIRYQIITPGPKPCGWRDCGAVLNYGIRAATGKQIILTHPEVIPGRMSVAKCVDKLIDFEHGRSNWPGTMIGCYAACKVYYLSPREQELIDTVSWEEEGNLALRRLPGFYEEDSNGNLDYKHHVTDKVATPGFRIQTWDSWVFGGCLRETWKRLGGMWVTQKWGSVDIGFNHRRKQLGMVEWTCPDDESIVTHQNHDGVGNVPTPRVEGDWMHEMRNTPQNKLCYPDVDELGW